MTLQQAPDWGGIFLFSSHTNEIFSRISCPLTGTSHLGLAVGCKTVVTAHLFPWVLQGIPVQEKDTVCPKSKPNRTLNAQRALVPYNACIMSCSYSSCATLIKYL